MGGTPSRIGGIEARVVCAARRAAPDADAEAEAHAGREVEVSSAPSSPRTSLSVARSLRRRTLSSCRLLNTQGAPTLRTTTREDERSTKSLRVLAIRLLSLCVRSIVPEAASVATSGYGSVSPSVVCLGKPCGAALRRSPGRTIYTAGAIG